MTNYNDTENLDFNFHVKEPPNFKKTALSYLKGKWIYSAIVFFIIKILSLSLLTDILNSFVFKYIIILNIPLRIQIISLIISSISLLFISFPFEVGIFNYCINIKNNKSDFKDIFYGFKIYSKTLILGIIIGLLSAIGLLLLVVPGMIIIYGFSMTPFILLKDTEISSTDALKLSWDMTRGKKMDIFLFELSFIGWRILSSIITLSLGDIFLNPYFYTAKSLYFENIYNEYYETK